MNIPNAATGGVLKTFCKIHRKTPVLVSFLIKLQAEACNFIKEEILGQVFFCQFWEIPENLKKKKKENTKEKKKKKKKKKSEKLFHRFNWLSNVNTEIRSTRPIYRN